MVNKKNSAILKSLEYKLYIHTTKGYYIIEYQSQKYKLPIDIISISKVDNENNPDEPIFYWKINIKCLENCSIPWCNEEFARLNSIHYILEYINTHNITWEEFNSFLLSNIWNLSEKIKRKIINILANE